MGLMNNSGWNSLHLIYNHVFGKGMNPLLPLVKVKVAQLEPFSPGMQFILSLDEHPRLHENSLATEFTTAL